MRKKINTPFRRHILAKYCSLRELAKQCQMKDRAIWCIMKGICTLETAVRLEQATNGYITCAMIKEHIDFIRSEADNAERTSK